MAKRAYSPKEVLAKTYKTLPWGEKWSQPFGFIPTNETWFISGASASGKSSFVMLLAKELANYGMVLYCSYEEGISQSFKERVERFKMGDVQGRFRVITDDSFEDLMARLAKPKSPHFIIVDSFQESDMTYEQFTQMRKRFPAWHMPLHIPRIQGSANGKTCGKTEI